MCDVDAHDAWAVTSSSLPPRLSRTARDASDAVSCRLRSAACGQVAVVRPLFGHLFNRLLIVGVFVVHFLAYPVCRCEVVRVTH
jgi:hypothetical protein